MRFVIRRLLACLSRAPMLAALALVCAFAPGASAVGGNPKALRSSSVLLGNGMAVDVSNTPSPLATSLVFSGADSLRGTRHVLRETLAREPFAADGPEPDADNAGPTRRAALEVAAEGLFDIFGFEVGASASFDPLCEFINPLLPLDDQLNCGQDTAAEEEEEPAAEDGDEEYAE